jgi:hypothetical protein
MDKTGLEPIDRLTVLVEQLIDMLTGGGGWASGHSRAQLDSKIRDLTEAQAQAFLRRNLNREDGRTLT